MHGSAIDLRPVEGGRADAAPPEPARIWSSLAGATAQLPAPVAAVHLAALRWNAHDLLRRAAGRPIRVATKSIRIPAVLDAVLALPGFRGALAYTLAEALDLAEHIDDVVVGYPSADRAALARLVHDADAAERVTLMVDSVEHLDLVDAIAAPSERPAVRVCLDLDASWRSRLLGHVGVRRSPLHAAAEAEALARTVVSRPGFRLVGVMAYEAQIAGVGDRPIGGLGTAGRGAAIRAMQQRSATELRARRADAVARIRRHAELEFVNGGGTGSLESTGDDPSVTELAAGSGLLAGHLFDRYTRFRPAPAAAFALDVVRRPGPGLVTVQGGGWLASGPPGHDWEPLPVWPAGLRLLPHEGAGEVQTPLRGAAADALRLGDRVWFRHAKSGELAEHVTEVALVDDGRVVAMLPTTRGEGRAYL